MPGDHYLPASVIGRFSTDKLAFARERKVYVLFKGKNVPRPMKAEKIGYVNDLYRVSMSPWGGTPTSVDPELHGYEPALPSALDLLEQAASIKLEVWLRTLVPYVAAMFVRGRDFIPRFMDRPSVAAGGELNTAENANAGRFIELERLLALVCCARWVVLHKTAGEPFILNDLGLTGTFDKITGQRGWAIPIGKDSALGIFPKPSRSVARYVEGGWRPIAEHRYLNGVEAKGLNDSMAHAAVSFVIGPDGAVLERIAPIIAEDGNARALMEAWPIDNKTRIAHAKEWHRLVTVAANNPLPDDLNDLQRIDVRALESGWCLPVGVILNMREFPTGLKRVGNVIRLSLDLPANYEDYFIRPETERSSE